MKAGTETDIINVNTGERIPVVVIEQKNKKIIKATRWLVENADSQEKIVKLILPNYVDFAVIACIKGYLSKQTWLCRCTISEISKATTINRNVVSRAFERLQNKQIMLYYKDKTNEGFVFNPEFYFSGDESKYWETWNMAVEMDKTRQATVLKRVTAKVIRKVNALIVDGVEQDAAIEIALTGITDVEIRRDVEFEFTPMLEEF